jgi:hypothetical protein
VTGALCSATSPSSFDLDEGLDALLAGGDAPKKSNTTSNTKKDNSYNKKEDNTYNKRDDSSYNKKKVHTRGSRECRAMRTRATVLRSFADGCAARFTATPLTATEL